MAVPDRTPIRYTGPHVVHQGVAVKDRLLRFFHIRPHELRPLTLAFLCVALVVASFLLAKPIRNGLFLNQFGAYKLVYVYVGVPLVLLVFVPLYTRLAANRSQHQVILVTQLFFVSNVLVFWYLFTYHEVAILPAVFYIWVNCYGVIAPVQAWTFVHGLFDTRQARRLFGLVGSGATVGALAGGLLARVLVGPVGGTVNLMLVLAALIGLSAAIVVAPGRLAVGRGANSEGRLRAPFRRTLVEIAQTRYLRLIAGVLAIGSIVTQWTQFQFSLVATERFAGDADRLTAFFGEFNFYLGLLALLIQILVTGPALRRFGIAVTLLVLPVALMVGSSLVVLFPMMWAVLVTSGLDQGVRFSVDKPSFELLYLPLGARVRANAKATIDMIVSRLADGVGGILLGLATQGFSLYVVTLPGASFGLRGVAAVNMVFIAIWIAVALALRRGYVETIRDTIKHHRLDAERAAATFFDRSIADILNARLKDEDPDEILYALSLLETQHRYIPDEAISLLLRHPSQAIRRRAMSMLRMAGDETVLPQVERLLQDPDLETRTEALLYLAQLVAIDPLERIAELGDFPDFSIRAGIVSYLARPGATQNLEAASVLLDAMVGEAGPEGRAARLEAARLLQHLPDEFDAQATRLLHDPDSEVVRHTLRAVAEQGSREILPEVLALLASVPLSAEATRTLSSFGDPSVDALRDALLDSSLSLKVRRKIPVVLMQIGTRKSQQALMECMLQADTSLRFRIIAALNKLQRERPDLALDRQTIEMILAAEILGHYRSYQIIGTLDEALAQGSTIGATLNLSLDQEVERIFRLLGLLYPEQDFHTAYFGLQSKSPELRANALELLDNILSPRLRDLLLPLLDGQVSMAERVLLANRLVGASVDTREQAVEALLHSDVPWLRAAAVHAIGTLGLHDLDATLDASLEDRDSDVRETARLAKARLVEARETEALIEVSEAEGVAEAAESMGVG